MSIEQLSNLDANQRWVIEDDQVKNTTQSSTLGTVRRRFHRKDTGLANVVSQIAHDISTDYVNSKEKVDALIQLKNTVNKKTGKHLRTGWVARQVTGHGNVKKAKAQVDQQAYAKLYEAFSGMEANESLSQDEREMLDRMYDYLNEQHPSSDERELFHADLRAISKQRMEEQGESAKDAKLEILRRLAFMGFNAAKTELAVAIQNDVNDGIGEVNDLNYALNLLQDAADSGNIPAALKLEFAYRQGNGTFGVDFPDLKAAHDLAMQLSDVDTGANLRSAQDMLTGAGVEVTKESVANAQDRAEKILTDPHTSNAAKKAAGAVQNVCKKLQQPPESIDRQAIDAFYEALEEVTGSSESELWNTTVLNLANAGFALAQFVASQEEAMLNKNRNLQQAAAAGIPEAQFQLAKALEAEEVHIQDDIFKSQPSADSLYAAAADQGHQPALLALGRIQANNIRDKIQVCLAVINNPNTSSELRNEAYRQIGSSVGSIDVNHPEQHPIVNQYSNHDTHSDKEYGSIGERFKGEYQSLKKPIAKEVRDLYIAGFLFKHGLIGVTKNEEIAQELYNRANVPEHFTQAGLENIQRGNYDTAYLQLTNALQLEQTNAAVPAGRLLELGLVKADRDPMELYAEAEDSDAYANYRMGEIASFDQDDEELAIAHYKKAAEGGNWEAMARLTELLPEDETEGFKSDMSSRRDLLRNNLSEALVAQDQGKLDVVTAFTTHGLFSLLDGKDLLSNAVELAMEEIQEEDADIQSILLNLPIEDQDILSGLLTLIDAMDTKDTRQKAMNSGIETVLPTDDISEEQRTLLQKIRDNAHPMKQISLARAHTERHNYEEAKAHLRQAADTGHSSSAAYEELLSKIVDNNDLQDEDLRETHALIMADYAIYAPSEENRDAQIYTTYTTLLDALEAKPDSKPIAKQLFEMAKEYDTDLGIRAQQLASWREIMETD